MSLFNPFHHTPREPEPPDPVRIRVIVDGTPINLDDYVNDPDAVAIALARLVADKPLTD